MQRAPVACGRCWCAWCPALRPASACRPPKPRPATCRNGAPAHGEVILEARHVTRRFGGLVANNDMSLEVRAGEILALIGPNGAGKSTLFNQLSGVDTPAAATCCSWAGASTAWPRAVSPAWA